MKRNPTSSTRLRIKVHARARRDKLVGIQGGLLRVKVTAPPVEGKANQAVIELLAAHLRVPKSSIRIVSGEHAPLKLVEVAGLDSATVAARLRQSTLE